LVFVIDASHRAVARSQAAGHYFGGSRHVLVDPCRFGRCGDTVTPAADELGLQRIQLFAPLRASASTADQAVTCLMRSHLVG